MEGALGPVGSGSVARQPESERSEPAGGASKARFGGSGCGKSLCWHAAARLLQIPTTQVTVDEAVRGSCHTEATSPLTAQDSMTQERDGGL